MHIFLKKTIFCVDLSEKQLLRKNFWFIKTKKRTTNVTYFLIKLLGYKFIGIDKLGISWCQLLKVLAN